MSSDSGLIHEIYSVLVVIHCVATVKTEMITTIISTPKLSAPLTKPNESTKALKH